MLTTGAFNALLKTLEEPPEHVIFILATTEPHKIPSTILSRCQRFDFRKISDKGIVERLKYICEEEKISIQESALFEIANLSDGGMRDSISLLDQVVSYANPDSEITENDVHDVSGTLNFDSMMNFVNCIINKDLESVLSLLKNYDENGINIKKFTEQLIKFLEEIILSKETPKYLNTIVNKSDKFKQFENTQIEMILDCTEILNNTLYKLSTSTNPKILLELSLIRIVEKMKQENIKLYTKILPEETTKTVETKEKKGIVSEVRKDKSQKEAVFYKIKSYDTFEKFKHQRINNVLSTLDKSKISSFKKIFESLKQRILDPAYGKYISLLLDAQIKATSKDSVIVVFEEKSASESFNENIPLVEKLLKEAANDDVKIISTYIDDWNVIKNEFNSKQKKYEYDINLISEEDVYEEETGNQNEIQDVFNEFIEYV